MEASLNAFTQAERTVPSPRGRYSEQHYQNELKSELEAIQARTVEQYEKLADSVDKVKLGMESNIQEIQDTFGDFQEETRSKISALSTSTDKELKTELERTVSQVQANLNRVQEELLADLKSFEEGLRERQDTGNSSIDALRPQKILCQN